MAFDRASFGADMGLNAQTRFGAGVLSFDGASFETTRQLGPILSAGTVGFDDATFRQRADLDVTADALTLVRSRFSQGANLWLSWAEVNAEKAEFGAPSIIASTPDGHAAAGIRASPGVTTRDGPRAEEALAARHADTPARTSRARLVSLRWALVGELTISGLELAPCRFHGAHHLECLRLEGGSGFAPTPRRRWLAHRLAIAEEHEWRASRPGRPARAVAGWYPPECQPATERSDARPSAEEIAASYRALRKGREEQKDEPGAADFYYGEMEMRRLASGARSAAERVILTLYWLVSGYGLRASRALAALALTVVAFGFGLYAWGMPGEPSLIRALTFSLESTTSLLRAPERELTLTGEWLQLGLRLLGPLFFGLALLSLRGRVRR